MLGIVLVWESPPESVTAERHKSQARIFTFVLQVSGEISLLLSPNKDSVGRRGSSPSDFWICLHHYFSNDVFINLLVWHSGTQTIETKANVDYMVIR